MLNIIFTYHLRLRSGVLSLLRFRFRLDYDELDGYLLRLGDAFLLDRYLDDDLFFWPMGLLDSDEEESDYELEDESAFYFWALLTGAFACYFYSGDDEIPEDSDYYSSESDSDFSLFLSGYFFLTYAFYGCFFVTLGVSSSDPEEDEDEDEEEDFEDEDGYLLFFLMFSSLSF